MKKVTWTGYRCKSCRGSGSSPDDIPFIECPFCHSSDIEKFDSNTNKKSWKLGSDINRKPLKLVSCSKCELEGPYECPWCGGHMMLDATFLDQVSTVLECPYCDYTIYVEDIK